MKIFFIVTLVILFSTNAHSQVLQKAIAKFQSLSNLSYTTIIKEKDLFSEKLYYDTVYSKFSLSKERSLFKISNSRKTEWYDGSKLIIFNLDDNTYRVFNSNEKSTFEHESLPEIMKSLAKDLQKNVSIKKLTDSAIGKKRYYQFSIKEYDSLKNNKRVFNYKTILIDKITLFPFFYRRHQQGFIDGTNTLIDIFYEHRFESYQTNAKENLNLNVIQIPGDFSLEKPEKTLPLLTKGTPAPEIELLDSSGNSFKLENQKGKIVLLNFTINGCPHCAESIEMLNNLYLNYKNKNLIIVTINSFDTDESVKSYYKKFHIKYPLFKKASKGKMNTDNYHVYSAPAFYLIDKNGNVVKGFSGYSKAIDEELTRLIKEYL